MTSTIAMLLAGGQGSRLSILSNRRAKPAVPFGGNYRIIDFTLSNIMHADIGVVGVLTQYKPHSLTEHIGTGEWWGFTGRDRTARILPPYKGDEDSDWYANTADAIWQNRQFIQRFDPDLVIVLSGDHIYKMDYAEMIRQHVQRRADVTVAVQPVPWEDTSRFGLVQLAEDGRVLRFQEKPKVEPISNLASLGIYVFDAQTLLRRLQEDANDPNSQKDFGKNVLPAMLAQDRMFGYVFEGYWRDVGTIESFWHAHMETLEPETSRLDLRSWGLRTNTYDSKVANYFPAAIGASATVRNSYIGRGCVVEGTVERSVLFPGVRISRGARVTDSVVFPNCMIGEEAHVHRCIMDKSTALDRSCAIGTGDENIANQQFPDLLDTGITVIGENVLLPPGTSVGRNVLIFPGTRPMDLPGSQIAAGSTIQPQMNEKLAFA
ncbi:MAG: glucose-1-phosphate adenylyltransferase family protein [Candidatus Sumerlaeaceae bacterium]